MDIRSKRGSFIGRIHSILQEVYFASPLVKMRMIKIYASSFYGSPLWNLYHGDCEKLYTAWNNAIREAFDVPRATHRYLIEEISESEHPLVMLSLRFFKFHQTLQKTSKISLRYLSQLSSANLRTSYSQNLKNIADRIRMAVEDLDKKSIKEKLKYFEVPEAQEWRVAVVKDLMEVRWNMIEINVLKDDLEELDNMLETLCVT